MKVQLQMSSGIFQLSISSESEIMLVMTCLPSFIVNRICGTSNRLVSADVIIHLLRAPRTAPKIVFDPLKIAKHFTLMTCC